MEVPINDRFLKLQEEYPNHSSYICFVRLMTLEGVSNERLISRYFNKFVEKGDYEFREKKGVLRSLFKSLQNKGIIEVKKSEFAPGKEKGPIPSPFFIPA